MTQGIPEVCGESPSRTKLELAKTNLNRKSKKMYGKPIFAQH